MKSNHPHDHSLALLASQDTGWWMRRSLLKHVRDCTPCQDRVAQFELLRGELADSASVPQNLVASMNWDALAAEMRANIRLGLEAGACVREKPVRRTVNPRLAVAFASLMVIVAASFLLRGSHSLIPSETTAAKTVMPAYEPGSALASGDAVLEANQDGLALKTGPASMTLLGHEGSTLSQSASAEGEIRARYVDGNTGVVTINNVYLQ